MARQPDMYKARQVYNTIISTLTNLNWKYAPHDEDLTIHSGAKGDDLPIEFILKVRPQQEVVQFISKLPFDFPEDKRLEGALAICAANYRLVDGCFDYNIANGEILFRLTSSYRQSILGEDLFEYMVMVSASTIDEYNDKFFMVAKDMMSIHQFIEQESK